MAARTIPAPRRVARPRASLHITEAKADRDVMMGEEYIVAHTGAGNVTLTLPDVASTTIGRRITFNDDQGGNDLLLQPGPADRISIGGGPGAAYNVTKNQMTSITLVSDGTDTWDVEAQEVPVADILGDLGSLVALQVDDFGAQAGAIRSTVVTAVLGGGGVPGQVVLGVKVFDDAALTTPSVNGVVSVGARGTAESGDGTNSAQMKMDGNSELDLDVTDAVGGGVNHWVVVTPVLPNLDNAELIWMNLAFNMANWA